MFKATWWLQGAGPGGKTRGQLWPPPPVRGKIWLLAGNSSLANGSYSCWLFQLERSSLTSFYDRTANGFTLCNALEGWSSGLCHANLEGSLLHIFSHICPICSDLDVFTVTYLISVGLLYAVGSAAIGSALALWAKTRGQTGQIPSFLAKSVTIWWPQASCFGQSMWQ